MSNYLKGKRLVYIEIPVVIDTVVVDRNAVDARQGVTILPSQESLEISYTGLSFIKPEQIRSST